jgi:hypothetical protein
MAYSDGPRGIAGWLLVFLISRGLAIVLAPVQLIYVYITLGSWAAATGVFWHLFMVMQLISTGLVMLADGYLIWRFIRRRGWRSVRIGIALLWTGLFTPAVIGAISALIAGMRIQVSFTDPATLFAFGTGVVWSGYLLNSKRVANTYVRYGTVEEDGLARVFE